MRTIGEAEQGRTANNLQPAWQQSSSPGLWLGASTFEAAEAAERGVTPNNPQLG